jgi:hypothetical protein
MICVYRIGAPHGASGGHAVGRIGAVWVCLKVSRLGEALWLKITLEGACYASENAQPSPFKVQADSRIKFTF